MEMDYNKYKHPKEIPIHFFGETMLRNNDFKERYQFVAFLIFRMLARLKDRTGPFYIKKKTTNNRLLIRLFYNSYIIYEIHEDFYGEFIVKINGSEKDFYNFLLSYIIET